MVGSQDDVDEVGKSLDEATTCLRRAIQQLDPLKEKSPWTARVDDLRLLKEQVVDVRQQLELLKLEVVSETEAS
jgi:hypothetical protein